MICQAVVRRERGQEFLSFGYHGSPQNILKVIKKENKNREEFKEGDVSKMEELEAPKTPPHCRDTDSTTVQETTPFVRNP